MDIKVIPGRKGPQDELLVIRTHDWEAPSFDNILTMIRYAFNSEERNYPHPKSGAEMLMNKIHEEYVIARERYRGKIMDMEGMKQYENKNWF